MHEFTFLTPTSPPGPADPKPETWQVSAPQPQVAMLSARLQPGAAQPACNPKIANADRDL
jgi:hypothetical protein